MGQKTEQRWTEEKRREKWVNQQGLENLPEENVPQEKSPLARTDVLEAFACWQPKEQLQPTRGQPCPVGFPWTAAICGPLEFPLSSLKATLSRNKDIHFHLRLLRMVKMQPVVIRAYPTLLSKESFQNSLWPRKSLSLRVHYKHEPKTGHAIPQIESLSSFNLKRQSGKMPWQQKNKTEEFSFLPVA